MSLDDREYMQEARRFRFGLGAGWSTAVAVIMAVNAVLFLAERQLPEAAGGSPPIRAAFQLDLDGLRHGQVWRLATYQFVHADWMHIILNMLGLYFLGPAVEKHVGTRRFVAIYMGGALAGGLAFALMAALVYQGSAALLGASAAVSALIIPLFAAEPGARLFFLDRKAFLWIFLIISCAGVLAELVGREPVGVSHVAHLGGFGAGWLLIRYRYPKAAIQARRRGRWLRQRHKQLADLRKEQETVDAILGKVKREGIASLTRREKRILQRATERERQRDRSVAGR